MNEEEKKLAEQEAIDEAVELTQIEERDARIAKLEEERDNYKNVALKRLGKLPGDAEFISGENSQSGLTVEEIVKNTLLEREIVKEKTDKDIEFRRLARENAELKLSMKNRPNSGMGNDSGASADVKDNFFSSSQIDALTQRAKTLKMDPIKFIDKAKANFLKSH